MSYITNIDEVMNIWKSYMWTAEWRIISMKIIAVIYATSAAAKRKPEKKIQACTGFKPLTSAIWEIGWRPARISNSSEDRRKASNKGSQRSSLKKGTTYLLVRVRAHVSGGKRLIAYHGDAVQWFYRSTTPFSRSWMIILVNYVQTTPTWNLSL